MTDFRTRVLERQGLDPLNTNHTVVTRRFGADDTCCCCGQTYDDPDTETTFFEVLVNGYRVFQRQIDPTCAEPTEELEKWLTQPTNEKP